MSVRIRDVAEEQIKGPLKALVADTQANTLRKG